MIPFVGTKEFKSLNIGLALDEGISGLFYICHLLNPTFSYHNLGQVSPSEDIGIYYCERMPWCNILNRFLQVSKFLYLCSF